MRKQGRLTLSSLFCLISQWLPWLLRMERPGKPKLSLKTMLVNSKMQQLEKADRYAQAESEDHAGQQYDPAA